MRPIYAALLVLGGCTPSVVTVAANLSAGAPLTASAEGYAPRMDGARVRVTNPAQAFDGHFDERGVTVGDAGGDVTLTLLAWGRDGSLAPAAGAQPAARGCLAEDAPTCVPRVEYARPGLVEWWVNGADGLEQGFTLASAPPGDGPLVIELGLTGAQVEVSGAEATLSRPEGDALRLTHLAAWDETGRDLPAHMEATVDGLRLVVDDTDAVGEITVDPLLVRASWGGAETLAPYTSWSSFAPAGDVNGDGYDDVVIGAAADGGEVGGGIALLYLGGAWGLRPSASWTAAAQSWDAQFGLSAASAGDVDGDGYDDLVIGAPNQGGNPGRKGRVFVYRGGAAGPGQRPDQVLMVSQLPSLFGYSVASAGDVDADGYDDVLVGAPNYHGEDRWAGAAFLYRGGPSGLSTEPAWSMVADVSHAELGAAVASAGDINGDGYSDVVIGAPGYPDAKGEAGRAYVFLGSAAGLAATPDWTLTPPPGVADLGGSVASAGDVNGDGYDDLILGAPEHWSHEANEEGQALVYLGSAAGLATTPAWRAHGVQDGEAFGASVASAGDLDGDGYGDVIVGACNFRGGEEYTGRALVYLGSATGPRATAAWTRVGDSAREGVGNAVGVMGDVDGDGCTEVGVGASREAWLYEGLGCAGAAFTRGSADGR